MKKIFILLAASLLFIVVGCVEGLHESGLSETSSEQLPNLTAGFAEGETKTYVESGKYLRWHEDDRLTAFLGNTLNRQYKFNGATGDNSGSFSYISSGNLETGNALDRIYAVYPYDETATITDDGKISLTLPAVQTYAENSFGRGANTMLAVTENVEDTFLGFKNACGYLKLKLYNPEGSTIKSVEVKGNGDEKVAGAATATIDFGEVPQLTMADDAKTTIALDCGDGVALGTTAEAATEFWVVIPETTFESGITITVRDTEGGIFEKSNTKEVVIERNAVQPMAALEVVCIKRLPKNNEIWYTATEKVEPYDKTVFGATYQSNEWNSATGEGVITFDNEVTAIGEFAFQFCYNLTSVTIPSSVTEIGDCAFVYCRDLTSVTIPSSVTAIGDGAFAYCNLTSVTIPSSVTTIGDGAFECCFSLSSVIIPDSITTIGVNPFNLCSSLQEFSGKFASEDGRCLVIEGVLKSFAPSGITGYAIPSSVTAIGGYAFANCNLTSVTIPDSVTAIGDYAFGSCSKLTSITIPSSVTTIGNGAFNGCDNLASVTIPDGVTTIGNGAFKGCDNLASVTIPDGVTTIGDSAFEWCSRLTSVTIPSSVTTIGNSAFAYCSRLTSITIPSSVTTIGNGAFNGCDNLTSVTIPDSVTAIGDYAFEGCFSLTSVTIPDSVTAIGDGAFSACYNLQEFSGKFASEDGRCLVVEGMLKSFASSGITDYTIPDGVTTIGSYAFGYCRDLTSVTIPSSVTAIGDYAFECCFSLTSIYCKPITPPAGGDYMFDNNAYGRKIYVPMESVSEYQSASYWKDYTDAIVGYNF